jgi:hypothetical protein
MSRYITGKIYIFSYIYTAISRYISGNEHEKVIFVDRK